MPISSQTNTTRPWLRLRQIALLVPSLRPVETLSGDVLGLMPCHRDPAVAEFGLENVLFPIGAQFLEIVAPVTPDCAGARQLARQGGAGGYMVITQCQEHAPFRARAQTLGMRIVNAFEQSSFIHMQLHPRDTGGSFLEIDEQRGPRAHELDGPWTPAGDTWQCLSPSRVSKIIAAEIACDEAPTVAARWAAITACPISETDAATTLVLDNAVIRFVPKMNTQADSLCGIHLKTENPDDVLRAARHHGLPVTSTSFALAGIRITLV